MELKGIKIGFALTGSFCTFKKVIPKMKELINQGAEIIPIMSFNSYNLDTKFGKAKDFIKEIEELTDKKIIHTIQEAEPIGPKKMTDIMVIAPCSRPSLSASGYSSLCADRYGGIPSSVEGLRTGCHQ